MQSPSKGHWFTLTVELEPGQSDYVALMELLQVKARLESVFLGQGKITLTEGSRTA